MKIIELYEIKNLLDLKNNFNVLISCLKQAFKNFSAGAYTVPMPMHFNFPEFSSDSHLKGAYRQGSTDFVIKIANGSALGAEGIILVFDCKTGAPIAMLRDQGYLTTVRTALAGLIVMELLPWECKTIGIAGSGSLALMLHELILKQYPRCTVYGYARNQTKLTSLNCELVNSAEALQENCEVIFTATSAKSPLFSNDNFNAYSAFIALGSDDEHKRELSTALFTKADCIVVDSMSQALVFGDVAHAQRDNPIEDKLIELGSALTQKKLMGQKIIADFSGIAAQDVAMVEFILSRIL
ncbi:hypothetical protein [Legionella sp. km772]|uniref:hypothetical protein n=1 Tax=Legionella sp. km772 TaxID=2498111 RepID=UPI000F8D35EC|nr:hypothetical protein [Legionella sp. km772]RUR05258.1 hypothetical protein ELY15_14535 [Legionella sp. km772]